MLSFYPNNIKPIILNHSPWKDFNIYETVKNVHYTHKGYYVMYQKKKEKSNIKPNDKWKR